MRNTKNKNAKGLQYNRLTIITEPYRKNRRTYVYAQCECTNIIEVQLYKIQIGHTKGCGCIKEKLRKHNLSKHPLYRIWDGMKYRCYNANASNYKNYGGRGITICDDWKNDFSLFYQWAIDNNWNNSLQVDRTNNDMGYSPENCRLVSSKENAQNRRTTKYVIFGEIVFTLQEAIQNDMINKSKFYKDLNYRNSFRLFGDITA